ncbi:hypothetical protein L7F22_062749 [Adiantum nelumboides]|nr:hypothetical protein [Adiantum nelumboides]
MYARLKEQYAKEFNGRDDIFDNDDGMADFIEDWHQNDSASDIPNNKKYLRKEALKCIYEGSQLTRLSTSLLILNLQNRFGWSNVSVSALLKWITSKEIDKGLIPQKKRECIELLCLMEKELPTSFFDIQVHLLIHLVDEIELAGVVSARWMFWAERFMGVLKGYARMYTNMWAYGQHLRIKAIDVMRLTQDSSVVASFEQLSRASSRDTNLVDSELGYVGTIVGIYEISYRIFKQVILKVDWFGAEYKGNSATMRREPSKFWYVDSSKLMQATREPYILPAHVEQAFFYKNPDSHPWWQVVHVQPRGRQLFDSIDPEEANQDELMTSSNLDTSMLETCRISLADHDGIVDDENDNHPYSDTTNIKEEEIVDVEHMEEMNVNTNLTAEEFEEVNKDKEDEILLTINLRDDDEDY